MEKIIVTAPKSKNGKWKVSMLGSSGKHRSSVNTVYRLVKHRLNIKKKASRVPGLEEKVIIKVNYGTRYYNESLASKRLSYLFFAFTCFLEDYLSEGISRGRYKRYGDWEEIMA